MQQAAHHTPFALLIQLVGRIERTPVQLQERAQPWSVFTIVIQRLNALEVDLHNFAGRKLARSHGFLQVSDGGFREAIVPAVVLTLVVVVSVGKGQRGRG
jgi:hypothetical protein